MKRISRVVVTDGRGRFLSVIEKNRKGRYAFPGGHIDPGELPHDAAARELFEETGLTAISLRMIGEIVDKKRHSFIFEAVATGVPRGSKEGPVVWAVPKKFLDGEYGEFSEKVFACWIHSSVA